MERWRLECCEHALGKQNGRDGLKEAGRETGRCFGFTLGSEWLELMKGLLRLG